MKEIMESVFKAYSTGNPPQIRNVIQGWDRNSNSNEEDREGQEESMDFVNAPRNTRGRLSLFHQTIHTDWTLKCILGKAMQILQPIDGSPKVISIIQQIKIELQDIKVSQYHATPRIFRIERQIQ